MDKNSKEYFYRVRSKIQWNLKNKGVSMPSRFWYANTLAKKSLSRYK